MPPSAPPPTLQHGVKATPMAFVAAILEAYRRAGCDPARALAAAQITPTETLEGHISAAQMEALSEFAMRELDDEALGWFERRLPWGSYGLLARASITSPDLGLALRRWCRHHALLTQRVTLTLQQDGEWAELRLSEHEPLGPMREFCLVSLMRNAWGLACWLVDSRIALRGVDLPFAAPPHQAVYPVLFPSDSLRFDAPAARLVFDARYLALPLKRDEAALQQMLQRALPLTVRHYRRDRLLVPRVRAALAVAPADAQTAFALAQSLHLSTRTLHRQLREEGASLQALKDEVRLQKAREWLLRSDRPLKQVAQAVGFRNEKSFIRAFRQWTGTGPGAFREQARSG